MAYKPAQVRLLLSLLRRVQLGDRLLLLYSFGTNDTMVHRVGVDALRLCMPLCRTPSVDVSCSRAFGLG